MALASVQEKQLCQQIVTLTLYEKNMNSWISLPSSDPGWSGDQKATYIKGRLGGTAFSVATALTNPTYEGMVKALGSHMRNILLPSSPPTPRREQSP